MVESANVWCLPTNWQKCKKDYRDFFMREALEMILKMC